VLVNRAGLGGLNAAIQLKKAGLILKCSTKIPASGVPGIRTIPGRAGRYTRRVYSHTGDDYDFDHLFAPPEGEREIIPTGWLITLGQGALRLSTEVLRLAVAR